MTEHEEAQPVPSMDQDQDRKDRAKLVDPTSRRYKIYLARKRRIKRKTEDETE